MSATYRVRNFLSISGRPPFDRLTAQERLLVAGHLRHRRHAPGELLLARGAIADRLIIVIGGAVSIDGAAASTLFDAGSALFGLPARGNHVAGPDGAESLSLARPHLFTIARECPDFVVGLAALGEEPRT